MATYSHSRISCFETCPYQYKLRYIDRVKVEVPTTIEAFMGDLVHRTLEKLYNDKKFKKRVSKSVLLKFYRELWSKEYSDDILVVKENLSSENYRRMGLKFISDYYDHYKPFDEMTVLGLETQDRMTLPDGNQWHVRIESLVKDVNFDFSSDWFRVVFKRETAQKTTQKTTQKIIELLKENPGFSRKELAQRIDGITEDGVKYNLEKMKKQGRIKRVGPDKGGYWKVEDEESG